MFSANNPVDSPSHIKFNFYLITEFYIGNTFFVIPHGATSITALSATPDVHTGASRHRTVIARILLSRCKFTINKVHTQAYI